MSDKAKELLLGLFNYPHNNDSIEYRYSDAPEEKSAELRAFKELTEAGYIIKKGSAIGFTLVSITPSGKIAAEQL